MIVAGQYDLRVSRRQPLMWEVQVQGVDLSAADVSFEARPSGDSNVTWLQLGKGAAGGANVVSVSVAQVNGLPATTFRVAASKALIEAIPLPSPLNSDLVGWYGLKIGGVDYLVGRFILVPRANHA